APLESTRPRGPGFGAKFMPSSLFDGARRSPTILAILLAAAFGTCRGLAADEERKPGKAESTRSGRTPWTASRVAGTPDPPPPFKAVRAFPNLKFDHPLLIVRYPGGSRLVVGEQAGILYSFADDPHARADLFLDLPRQIQTIRRLAGAKEVESVYGLALHPGFERNRQWFVRYTLPGSDPRRPTSPDRTRLSR